MKSMAIAIAMVAIIVGGIVAWVEAGDCPAINRKCDTVGCNYHGCLSVYKGPGPTDFTYVACTNTDAFKVCLTDEFPTPCQWGKWGKAACTGCKYYSTVMKCLARDPIDGKAWDQPIYICVQVP